MTLVPYVGVEPELDRETMGRQMDALFRRGWDTLDLALKFQVPESEALRLVTAARWARMTKLREEAARRGSAR